MNQRKRTELQTTILNPPLAGVQQTRKRFEKIFQFNIAVPPIFGTPGLHYTLAHDPSQN